jgi:dienelactone hydrolase
VKDRITHPMSWTSGAYTDFAQWKQLARKRVQSAWLTAPPVAPWNVTVIGEEDRGSYVVRKLVFNATGDSRLLAYLTVPKGKGSFPAVLLLHDHGGRYEIGKEKVIRPWGASEAMTKASEVWAGRLYGGRHLADELSKRGYVTFVTDAINWGDRGGGGLAGQQALASNLMHFGMSFAGVMAWEDQRAADFLAEQPEVDSARVAAMGLSMGGYRTWQVAALSDRIKVGVSICWMGTMKSMMVPGLNQTTGSSAYSMLHPGLLADFDYPDIASIAAPKPMLFYNGRYDRLFPASGVTEAYAKLNAVWAAQRAADRLETRVWNVEHVFDRQMQEAAFDWLDGMFNVK